MRNARDWTRSNDSPNDRSRLGRHPRLATPPLQQRHVRRHQLDDPNSQAPSPRLPLQNQNDHHRLPHHRQTPATQIHTMYRGASKVIHGIPTIDPNVTNRAPCGARLATRYSQESQSNPTSGRRPRASPARRHCGPDRAPPASPRRRAVTPRSGSRCPSGRVHRSMTQERTPGGARA